MNARISLNGKIVKKFFGAVKGILIYQPRIRLHITTSGSLWYRTMDPLHHNLMIFAIISKFEKFDKPEKPFTLVLDINDLHYLLDLINDDEIIEISLNSDKPSEIRSELFLLELERLPDTSIKKDPNKFEIILNNGAMINVDKLKNVLRILDYTVIQLASDTGKCIVRSSLENCKFFVGDSMGEFCSLYSKEYLLSILNNCPTKKISCELETDRPVRITSLDTINGLHIEYLLAPRIGD